MSDLTPAHEAAIASVEALFQRYKILSSQRPDHLKSFDHELMNKLKLLDAGPEGFVEYEITISENLTNLSDVLHGGAAAVLFDITTTTALCPLARPGSWEFLGGITRSLNLSYLRPVPLHSLVRLRCRVLQAGTTMALIRGEMVSPDGRLTYATAEHHKVNRGLKVDLDGAAFKGDGPDAVADPNDPAARAEERVVRDKVGVVNVLAGVEREEDADGAAAGADWSSGAAVRRRRNRRASKL